MPNKNDEEKKRIKRERERERRRKIKEDPQRREEQRERERQKYLRQRENKLRKLAAEMTDRELRKQRKKWKQYTRTHRMRLKEGRIEEKIENASDVPSTSDGRKQYALKRSKRMKIERHREKKKSKEVISSLRKKVDKWKKRFTRLKDSLNKSNESTNPLSPSLTPGTRVQNIMDESSFEQHKVEAVKKQLLFGEVIREQLSESYKTLKTKEKQVFKKIVNGSIIKKYKLETMCAKTFKYRSRSFVKKPRTYLQYMTYIKQKMVAFLEDDMNSRQCPGKKEYVTKHKMTHQKRYLNNTLKNIYADFCKKYPSIKVSYTFFCRYKPFWIKSMRLIDRDTCKCVVHANVELMIDSMWKSKIIQAKTLSQVIKEITCQDLREECLFRKCSECKQHKLIYNCSDKELSMYYFQWTNVKTTFFNKRSTKTEVCLKIAKIRHEIKVFELLDKFTVKIDSLLAHEGRILHQYNAIKSLKQNMSENEILIHCDFSENYSLKYSEEVQSYHFGGSRQQISLHTVVTYTRYAEHKIRTESYCTLSESLEHGPAGIWAHLYPILQINFNKNIRKLHFLSDSPSSQYRNKKMFSFLANHVQEYFPGVELVTWNYHEAGHGKGAPDGIGGVCKRTADRAVAHGRDVSSFKELVQVLKDNCPGVTFFEISIADVEKFATVINESKILPFRGTMKVHQVTSLVHTKTVTFRELSCFQCNEICQHFHIGMLNYQEDKDGWSSDEELFTRNSNNNYLPKLNFEEVYSSSSDEDLPLSKYKLNPKFDLSSITRGTHVLVNLISESNKRSHRFVAICDESFDPETQETMVTFFKACSAHRDVQLFKLEETDRGSIESGDIVEILPVPTSVIKGKRTFYRFPKAIDL